MRNYIIIIFCLIFTSITAQDEQKANFFFNAIEEGDINKIEQYLLLGIDINNTKKLIGKGSSIETSYTPLCYAIVRQKKEVINYLLQKGADVNLPSTETTIVYQNLLGTYKNTSIKKYPVDYTTELINYECLTLLVSYNADLKTAQTIAQNSGNFKLMKWFNDHGVSFSFNQKNLQDALYTNKPVEYIDFLLNQKILPNTWSLIYGYRNYGTNMLKKLVMAGGDVNGIETIRATGNVGTWCVLCEAIKKCNIETIKYLVEEGSVNIQGECCDVESLGSSCFPYNKYSERSFYNKCDNSNEIAEYFILAPAIKQQRKAKVESQAKDILANGNKLLAGGYVTAAENEFNKAYQLTHDNNYEPKQLIYKYFYDSAIVNYNNKNFEIAFTLFNKAFDANKNYLAKINAINCLIAQGNFDEAELLSTSMLNESKNLDFLRKRAYIHLNKNEFDLAKLDFEKDINLASNGNYSMFYISQCNYDLACFYSVTNNINSSLEFLEKALKQGYNKWSSIRTDEYLKNIRTEKKYDSLLKKYKN